MKTKALIIASLFTTTLSWGIPTPVTLNAQVATTIRTTGELASDIRNVKALVEQSRTQYEKCNLVINSETTNNKLLAFQDEMEKTSDLINAKASLLKRLEEENTDTQEAIVEVKTIDPKKELLETLTSEESLTMQNQSIIQTRNLLNQMKLAIQNDQKNLKKICSNTN